MTKERRLGRGLEALLGQLPPRTETAAAPVERRPQTTAESVAMPGPTAPIADAQATSAESLFWLDGPHGSAGTLAAQPHRVPVQQSVHQAVGAGVVASPVHVEAAPSAPQRISVKLINRNPAQPRKDFDADEIRALSESLDAHGLLQPVVVRRVRDRYQLVAGERRLRAAIEAGWNDVPVNIVEADDRQMAELAIVENLQRKDLNALEKAASFQKYLDEYRCTQEELAGRLKLDRSTIANLIRLLELPEKVQAALRHGKITQGHARALLPLGDEREQVEFCQRIQQESLSVRQTEALVQDTIDATDREPLADAPDRPASKPTKSGRSKNDHLAALEQEFRAALGMKVKITHNARGRGKLVVQFRNHEEFEQLKEHICGR